MSFFEGLWSWLPSSRLIWGTVLAACALVLVAVSDELLHRRRKRRQALASAWQAVEQLIESKSMPERESRFLRVFLKNYAPAAPYRAITERALFNACVELDIADTARLRNPETLREHGTVLRAIRRALGLDFCPIGQPIHSTRELSRGQPLWVSPAGKQDGPWARASITGIDEAFLQVRPSERKRGLEAKAGLMLQCRLWREEDARYLFTSTIDSIEGAPEVWKMRHSGGLKRVQARSHYRIRLDRDIVAGLVPAPLPGSDADIAQRKPVAEIPARLLSLSAGGFALMVQQPVSDMVLVRISIGIGAGRPVEGTGRVVGVSPVDNGYLVRTSFTELDVSSRERIARFVFQQQKSQQGWELRQPAAQE